MAPPADGGKVCAMERYKLLVQKLRHSRWTLLSPFPLVILATFGPVLVRGVCIAIALGIAIWIIRDTELIKGSPESPIITKAGRGWRTGIAAVIFLGMALVIFWGCNRIEALIEKPSSGGIVSQGNAAKQEPVAQIASQPSQLANKAPTSTQPAPSPEVQKHGTSDNQRVILDGTHLRGYPIGVQTGSATNTDVEVDNGSTISGGQTGISSSSQNLRVKVDHDSKIQSNAAAIYHNPTTPPLTINSAPNGIANSGTIIGNPTVNNGELPPQITMTKVNNNLAEADGRFKTQFRLAIVTQRAIMLHLKIVSPSLVGDMELSEDVPASQGQPGFMFRGLYVGPGYAERTVQDISAGAYIVTVYSSKPETINLEYGQR
jgi:hypothetical protein